MPAAPDVLARAVEAVVGGDAEALRAALAEAPDLATTRVDGQRTLLHVLTDWPGQRPGAAETVAVLVAAGADVDAPFIGGHAETPLHWAASSDDLVALDALLDAGADIGAPGGVVGDGSGTPIFDATVFGQWAAARRLLERGAATGGWEQASLGLTTELAQTIADAPHDECNRLLWAACHGGQRESAEMLLTAGAELNWVSPWDSSTPWDVAVRSGRGGLLPAVALADWLRRKGARGAGELGSIT